MAARPQLARAPAGAAGRADRRADPDGFLLTVPFTAGFDRLTGLQRGIYLAVLEGSIAAMVLLLAPVALHRQLFRRGERRWLVETGSRLARIGLVVLAATNVGAVWLVADVVTDSWVAWTIAGPTAALALWLWWVLPWTLRRRRGETARRRDAR